MTENHATRSKLLQFYAFLALVYVSDIVVLVGIIWNTYKITASSWFLGVVLSISIITPYLLRKIFPKANLLHLNLKQLFLFRIFIYALILLVSRTPFSESYLGITLLIIFYGVLTLSTQSAFEARNTQLVINKSITSGNASRIMQTVMQAGAFVGSLVSGLLSAKYPLAMTLLFISLFDITLSLIALTLLWNHKDKERVTSDINTFAHKSIEQFKASSDQIALFFTNGLIGLHIAAFNVLTPIFFQSLNHWSSQQFGIAAGISGLGALSAALLKQGRFSFLLCSILLVIGDTIFCLVQIRPISLAACFFIGFSLNTIRIGNRVKMIDSVRDDKDAHPVAAQSATYFSAFQAIGPLVMGFLLTNTFFGLGASKWMLPVAALLIFASIVIQGSLIPNRVTKPDI
ncbi:MFS transporter [Rouxiella sp. WC2420]|uniref:MFS transporter n=1 Tax=Rouxiella sp. WC2420 TaxID=3234145 RepID=A0AB39VTJ2_9GAMM